MKGVEEIYQELAAQFQSRTGLTAGGSGDLAVRFYAVAAQLYGLYAQAEWTEKQCFPQTATGEKLELHAGLRGVARRPASKAGGTVRFYAARDRLEAAEIPEGTVCMTADGRRYVTTGGAVIAVGVTELDVPVEAVEAGSAWNAEAGTIVYLAVPPSGVTACANPEALTNGQDREGDESLRERVLATYNRLANGANAAFYHQEAMGFDGVAAAAVLPRNRGVGTVDVVVAARGGMPDQALLDSLQAHFDSVREIAVDVRVCAPTEAGVVIAVTLAAEGGYAFEEVSQTVRAAVSGWFTGELLGKSVLQAALTALVFGCEGVANCTVAIDGGDLAGDSVTLPCLGALTITEG